MIKEIADALEKVNLYHHYLTELDGGWAYKCRCGIEYNCEDPTHMIDGVWVNTEYEKYKIHRAEEFLKILESVD